MPFNFDTPIPTYQPRPFDPEEHRNATEVFFYPQPLPSFFDDEEDQPPQQQEQQPPPPSEPDNAWNLPLDNNGWGLPNPTLPDWNPEGDTWYSQLSHNSIAIDFQYPSPPPSPKPNNERFPLNPIDLVRHYLFDPHHTDFVNIQRLKSCSPYPELVKLVLRHTFWNPEHAAPLLYGLKIVLDLSYSPYITRRIRHRRTLHAHFAPYPEDPFCTCECCIYCPLHPFRHARDPERAQAIQ